MTEVRLNREILEELYLFGDQANEELGRLAAINRELLERCVDLEDKANTLERALNRALTVMCHMEKRHHEILSEIKEPLRLS